MFKHLIFTMALLINSTLLADTAAFDPPEGWRLADTKALPKSVKIMVVGSGKKEMPPSINLGTEQYAGTLKEYLKIIQAFNKSQGDTWRDLGTIETQAGPASLSQLDMKSQWGDLRMLHLIFIHEGTVYILTASALKEEFASFYPQFIKSLKSIRLQKDT